MKPEELTAKQVLNELTELITKYPDRNGRALASNDVSEDEDTCVYYTDEDGVPVSLAHWSYPMEDVGLVTPVCIVGQWVEDFHPEFKDNELIYTLLRENSTLSACREDQVPFNREVWSLLSHAQRVQDSENSRWGDIDFEEREW